MIIRKVSSIIVLMFAALLIACGGNGGNDIVGRWEPPEDVALAVAYEFYPDGTGASFNNPYQMTDFTYTLAEDGALALTWAVPEERTQTAEVTFETADRMVMEWESLNKPITLLRTPLPDLPAHARVALALTLIDKSYAVLEAEQVDDLEAITTAAQRVVFASDLEIPPDEVQETWLAPVQVEGEEEPREMILLGTDTPERQHLVWAVGYLAETRQGTLTGVQVSFSLDDAADGAIDRSQFGGVVVVELDDGHSVDAICDEAMWTRLKGGQALEVAPIEGSEYWQVVQIVE